VTSPRSLLTALSTARLTRWSLPDWRRGSGMSAVPLPMTMRVVLPGGDSSGGRWIRKLVITRSLLCAGSSSAINIPDSASLAVRKRTRIASSPAAATRSPGRCGTSRNAASRDRFTSPSATPASHLPRSNCTSTVCISASRFDPLVVSFRASESADCATAWGRVRSDGFLMALPNSGPSRASVDVREGGTQVRG